jgi:hypothetical protein
MSRRAVLRTAGTLAAIAAAVVGVVLYAQDPRGLTYNLNLLLLTPLVSIVLYAASQRLPYRLQWGLALILAPVGAAAYLLWPNEQWWNYGALLALPLTMLALDRQDRLEREQGRGERSYGAAGFTGPFGPP